MRETFKRILLAKPAVQTQISQSSMKHLRTLRHKRFHEDAREKKKRKVAEARRKMKFMRQRKRRSQQQGP